MRTGAIGVVGLSMLVATAASAEPSRQEMLERLEVLEQRIADLETDQRTTDARLTAAQVDAVVGSVIADAEARSEMFSLAGPVAGYDTTFFLRSDDGAFKLTPYLLFQFRHVAAFDDEGTSDSGFEMRRARLGLLGHAFEDVKYFLLAEA
ncbi:MAG: hypothetical protein AAF747_12065, partial [Planctomycetota bacterium]